jgi:prepilin-type N-terminal cleavage/methylation domain-containing protein
MNQASLGVVRRGFTLVELLVVIAIIGVLVALLLPAVQTAREAARRSSCTNNLRQLGLALHNHHDVKLTLPPGGTYYSTCCTPPCYTNWAIEILPYIEQQSLYQLYRQDQLNVSANNNFVGQQRIKTHECPSDALKGKLDVPASGPRPAGQQWMHSSYRAVSGRANMQIAWGVWDGYEPQNWPGNVMDHMYKSLLHAVGMSYNGAPVSNSAVSAMGGPERFANATDGLSNTLMLGEYTTRSNTGKGTFWAYTYASYNQSSVGAESRLYGKPYGASSSDLTGCWALPGKYGDQMCKRAFNSEHPSGANWTLGDGSVRFISYNVDMNLLQNMATMAAGETNVVPE